MVSFGKLFCLVVFAAFFAVPFASAASSQSLGGTLSVSGLQYLPQPAVPGQYVDVWMNIQNNKVQAGGVQCELRPEYPFSLDANENALRVIGTLGSGQNFVLKYKVRVDNNAILGDNSLKIACKTLDSDWLEAEMTISLQSQSKSLTIHRFSLDPSEIAPGSTAVMTLELENVASTPVREVTVKLDLSSQDIPLVPIGSVSQQSIPIVGGNARFNVSFSLVALADAAPKAYKVPLSVSYKDHLGNSYSINDTAGIIINAKPVIEAFVEESKILRDNSAGTVIVKVVNRGLSEIKFLSVRAQDTSSVKVITPREFYAGNLESDDFDTIEYSLSVKGAGSTAVLPLTLSYRDANNHEYSQDVSLGFKLYSQDEINEFGLEPQPGVNWLLVVGVLAVACFIIYRFYWKKRKPSKG